MATKRMISNEVIRTDDFAKMSQGAQLLYFYLNMTADDDGFNPAPLQEMNRAKASEEDLKQLINHRYVICFESGVIVVRHWLINNKLSSNTYHSTIYADEKQQLGAGRNGEYELLELLPTGAKSLPLLQMEKGTTPLAARDLINEYKTVKYRIDKPFESEDVQGEFDKGYREEEVRGDKVSEDKESGEDTTPNANPVNLYGEMHNVFLLPDEYKKICELYENYQMLLDKVSHYLNNTSRTYMSHYSLIRKIAINDNWPIKTQQKKYNANEYESEKEAARHEEIREIMQEYSVDEERAEEIYRQKCKEAKDKVMQKYGVVKKE